MGSLLYSTFLIMLVAFAIGLFISLIIKLIVAITDRIDFRQNHYAGLNRLKRIHKMKRTLGGMTYFQREQLIKGYINDRDSFEGNVDLYDYHHGFFGAELKSDTTKWGISVGISNDDIIDHFYPSDKIDNKVEEKSKKPKTI